MKDYKNLTIFFVSYFSKIKIEKIIKKINSNIKVLVIDNANESGLKNYFEKKFKNIKVLTSKNNSGQSGGINLGLKNIKTKYAIYMDSDIKFNKNIINYFIQTAKLVNDFLILAPQHEKNFYKRNFISREKSKFKNLTLMKLIHGHFMYFNMKNVKKVGMFDTKFFLYFEETDFCLRAYRKKMKIYAINNAKVEHEGGWSVDLKNKLEIETNKHWHYMWSKFYYFKKNYSTFLAYKKTLPDLATSIIKIVIFLFFDKRKTLIYCNKVLGLLNSYFGKRSYKRLKI